MPNGISANWNTERAKNTDKNIGGGPEGFCPNEVTEKTHGKIGN